MAGDVEVSSVMKANPRGPAMAVAHAFAQLHAAGIVPDYEVLLANGYKRFVGPGQVVLDIGAHSGQHLDQLVELVGLGGRAIAFEPIPALAAALVDKYRNHSNVEIRNVALADHTGHSDFVILQEALGMSGFKQRVGSGDQGAVRISVQVNTLDREAAALKRLDYIKIDIEGAEIKCLRGAQRTVARHRPIISVEYGKPAYSLFGSSNMTLFEWAHETGYTLSDLFGNLISDAQEWATVCDCSFWDYFLVPEERRQGWMSLFGTAVLPSAFGPLTMSSHAYSASGRQRIGRRLSTFLRGSRHAVRHIRRTLRWPPKV